MKEKGSAWAFSRIGGVDQVILRNGTDIANLGQLDQKLWAVLAMPTGLPAVKEILDDLDKDRDGKIRIPDILRTIDELKGQLVSLDALFEQSDRIAQDQLLDEGLRATVRKVVDILKTASTAQLPPSDQIASPSVDLAAVDRAIGAFSSLPFNGDGIVTIGSASDEALKGCIEAFIQSGYARVDACGGLGIDAKSLEEFGADLEKYRAWIEEEYRSAMFPSEEEGRKAIELFKIIQAPLDDYFKRCGILAMAKDSSVMAELTSLMASILARNLPEDSEELSRLPLAMPEKALVLHLDGSMHPSFGAATLAFFGMAAKDISARKTVTLEEWADLSARLGSYAKWLDAKPRAGVCELGGRFVKGEYTDETLGNLRRLIEEDLAMADTAESLKSLRRLMLLKRDFLRILGNFASLDDFYVRKRGLFKTGRLFLDGRELELCMDVRNPQAHAAMAGLSSMYLVYCDLLQKDGRKKALVAALTAGDADNIFVGRNGIFYDSEGEDWDAVVTKIVVQPISIREAFFSPYKWLVRTLEEFAMKRAANAEAANLDKMKGVAQSAAAVGRPEAKPEQFVPKKVDVGTVAAIGVALGSIGAMVTGILGMFFGMGAWMPLGIVGVFLLISGPSMILAYMKLRKRNIGPLLNAEGWAVNGRLKINVPFGATLSHLAALPLGSRRQAKDPFAGKKRAWWLFSLFLVIAVLVVAYLAGWLKPLFGV